MPSFRLLKDARDWFRVLREDEEAWSLDFDSFYFCFMAGIAAGEKKSDVPDSKTAELVDYFPGRYGMRGKLIVAIFLSRELEKYGLTMDDQDKQSVHKMIRKYVDPDARNYLNDLGVRVFNSYAHGGFDVLREWFDDKPRSLATFVRMFKQKLDESIGEVV